MEASPNQKPWYADGLRFRCTQCGNCCSGEPGFVWVDDAEVRSIAGFLDETPEQFVAMHTRVAQRGRTLREREDGACVFYARDRGCTIYPVRPRQCQTWPFWESNVRSPEAWRGAGSGCPGIDDGELITPEEITRRLSVIRL